MSSKTNLLAGFASATLVLMLALASGQGKAGILVQTNTGVCVNGTQFAAGFQAPPGTMSGIVLVPDVRGNSGFMSQRAMAWGTYNRRGDSSTGFLLVDPAGSGTLSATSPRQATARTNAARANAYRLEYFKK
ncbi:MAG: hypothetical protein NTX56_19630 [Proteobacteria bacterium]|nr:hypothetical protein [Pseudomonadota bacterium]